MFKEIKIEDLNRFSQNSLLSHLSMSFTEVGDDFICATMPVNDTTKQPLGYLHGGASIALAESLGSTASYLLIDPNKYNVFGIGINANHVRSKRDGVVKATAHAINIGSKTHIWDIKIEDEQGRLISIVRLTNMVVDAK